MALIAVVSLIKSEAMSTVLLPATFQENIPRIPAKCSAQTCQILANMTTNII